MTGEVSLHCLTWRAFTPGWPWRTNLGTRSVLLWVQLSMARGNAAPEVDLVENLNRL